MIRIGLLGCGRIGQVHAASIAHIDGASVAAVADPFPAAASALATKTGAAIMDASALIASKHIDAVVIGTPTATHYALIHQIAAAGKAIFCEKPIDLSAQRILDCKAAVEAADVLFLTAFNRRFDPNFAQLRQQIIDGAIGNVEMLNIISRDPAPPPIEYIKGSGGLFRDMMIHDFDMARFLLAEEPISVYAVASVMVDSAIGAAGDVDTAAVTMTTASGKICQISNSRRASYGYDQRLEVHGERGMLRAENQLENTVELANADGFRRATAEHFFLQRYANAYSHEMQHFVDAINGKCKVSPGLDDGYRAQCLADAASESHTHKRVVHLDI